MAKKQSAPSTHDELDEMTPTVAAVLTGTIYQARLFNRQARMNVPEDEVISEVVGLWLKVMAALKKQK